MRTRLQLRRLAAFGVMLLLAAALSGCVARFQAGSAPGVQSAGALSALVAAAPSGGTVLVPAGTYREQVEISKPLTLKPAGSGRVIIDGECKRNDGVTIPTGSQIKVEGIEITNTIGAGVLIGNGPDDAPPAAHVTLDAMTISNFDCQKGDAQYQAGIAVWDAGCCMTLTDNTITYRTNGDGHGRGDDIWFKSNTAKPSGGHHYIAGNTVSGGWDGIGGETEADPHGTFDGDTVIEHNTVSGCWDDGIQAEGGDANVHVRANDVSACGTGIAFAAAITGPLFVEGNTIHDLSTGLYDNLFCFKIGNPGGGTVRLRDNVCRTDGDGLSQTNNGISPIVSVGNCYQVSRYVMEIGDALSPGSSFDGDVMWTSDPDGRFVKWAEIHYGSLGEFQSATGLEAHGSVSQDCPVLDRPTRTPIH
jgi:hypothetical protein